MKPELLIATTNENKFLEIQLALSTEIFAVRSLKEFPGIPEAEEAGSGFGEIARNKAFHYARKTGKPVLAEDSGLVIPSLEGFPGIYSARIAPDDASRIQVVLAKLLDRPEKDRCGYYICCMAFIFMNNVYETEGRCAGRIAENPRGKGGFGYDPIFYPENLDRTFAMMDLPEKMIYSHRGRAVRKMIPYLRSVFT